MEQYLKDIHKIKLRRAFTAFRIGAHNLEIETGRYIRDNNVLDNNGTIKRNDRFCIFCYEESKTKVMGDEGHAIINCPRFNDIRNSVFAKINAIVPQFKNLEDKHKLLYMLTCESECASLVGKLLNVILSTQRSNFIKIWKESIIPDDLKCV